MNYFDKHEAAAFCSEGRVEEILKTVAWRYMGENPANPCHFYVYRTDGFPSLPDGRILFDFNEKFPESRQGEYAWARACFFKEEETTDWVRINCLGPVSVWVNEELVFESTVREEVNHRIHTDRYFTCKPGWNQIVLRFQKTTSGFGAAFGSALPKWRWSNYISVGETGRQRLGFLYSAPVGHKDTMPEEWYPREQWGELEQALPPLIRIFGSCPGKYLYAWTIAEALAEGGTLKASGGPDAEFFIDGVKWKTQEGSISLPRGEHSVLIRFLCREKGGLGGYALIPEGGILLSAPGRVVDAPSPWIYAGPFSAVQEELEQRQDLHRLVGEGEEKGYWRVDEPCGVVRPVLENRLFGRWNYPLGVTLYGLESAARFLKNDSMLDYAARHLTECAEMYEYSLWDKEQYGYPHMNIQIANMSMLDDCGSFGNALLEYDKEGKSQDIQTIGEDIAFYMTYRQERREDGAFYRRCRDTFMEDTLWADDLYMSVPFLCRWYQRTGDKTFLEDAVNQYKQYKKYLYMPEQRLMSHVYDFKYQTPTCVAWGRGNGWVYFSLSELLMVVPKEHPDYRFLLEFYGELSQGYLKTQTEEGLWCQVLDEPQSYQEASCTSMFLCGLCRGIRFQWLKQEQKDQAMAAAMRAWKGLISRCVDGKGNIYGISAGSDYSFKKEYYKEELPWVKNDPHGIGIFLLAGIELLMTF